MGLGTKGLVARQPEGRDLEVARGFTVIARDERFLGLFEEAGIERIDLPDSRRNRAGNKDGRERKGGEKIPHGHTIPASLSQPWLNVGLI